MNLTKNLIVCAAAALLAFGSAQAQNRPIPRPVARPQVPIAPAVTYPAQQAAPVVYPNYVPAGYPAPAPGMYYPAAVPAAPPVSNVCVASPALVANVGAYVPVGTPCTVVAQDGTAYAGTIQ